MTKKDLEDNDVLSTIYKWSLDKSPWQRDALRRILQKSELEEKDKKELVALIKKENGFFSEKNIVSEPISQNHFFSNSNSDKSLILNSICDVKGVNILAPNQILKFNKKGVTVVYGDNASGKSGYARILKNACRARHREKIIPNIFALHQDQSTATIKYQSDDDDNIKDITWSNSPNPNPTLSSICIFDSKCAKVLIKQENKIAFKPHGLDIPDRFASLCKEIEEILKEELRILENKKDDIFVSQNMWSKDTKIGDFLSNISSKTKKGKAESLCQISDGEKERIEKINEMLSKDIQKLISEEKLKFNRIKNFIFRAKEYEKILSDSNLHQLIENLKNLESCKKASEMLAKNTFLENSFPDINNNTWKQLWESARNFSEKYAYKEEVFPVTQGNDKLCILCQQTIDKKTSIRFQKFDDFVKSDIEEKTQLAEMKLKNQLKEMSDLKFANDQNFKPLLDEMRLVNGDNYSNLVSYIASLRLKKIVFSTKAKRRDLDFISINVNGDLVQKLENQKLGISKYIEELSKLRESNNLESLRKEKKEIEDKLLLKKLTSAVNVEIDRLTKLDKLKKCISSVSTRKMTQLGNTIADKTVTQKLGDTFSKEIRELIGNRFKIELQHTGGKHGSPKYKINLIADPKLDVSLILSEGEQTCVAIAAFFAELSTSSHSSALVFDDPITSLAHKWRNTVAKRLVTESKKRQVIIFTHDLVFFNDISDYCEKEGVNFSAKQLQRYPEVSGHVDEDQPWDGMKVVRRIDALEKEARKLNQDRSSYSEEDYKIKARSFYSKLRASWERGLEEIALCNVIIRHRDYICTKNLNKISSLDLDDCKIWSSNFQKCCDFTDSHDSAAARNQSLRTAPHCQTTTY